VNHSVTDNHQSQSIDSMSKLNLSMQNDKNRYYFDMNYINHRESNQQSKLNINGEIEYNPENKQIYESQIKYKASPHYEE